MKKLLVLSAILCAAAVAQAGPGPDGNGPRKPPAEAYTACEKLSEGAACTVTHGDHTMTGTCKKLQEDTALVCFPDHPPGGHHKQQ